MDKNTTQMMKLTYILQNKDGLGKRVPRGESWQWVHAVQDTDALMAILEWLAKRVHVDRLELMNVYLDHVEITAPPYADLAFAAKPHIRYSKITSPHRVIDMHHFAEAQALPCSPALRLAHRQSSR